MRIAGFGFRKGALAASLRAALEAAGGEVVMFATLDEKAGEAAIVDLAAELMVTLRPLSRAELARQDTPTRSERVMARFGTGSLCEAAALAAAGRGARLVVQRIVSPDGLATVAIAERKAS